MLVKVFDDENTEAFSYDTDKTAMCLYPGREEKNEVIAALEEASRFLKVGHNGGEHGLLP